jgi:hypothetical protein
MQPSHSASEALLDMLVEEGLLSRTMAEALAARVRDSWIPLGKILRQQGTLTMAQLMDLLQEQANAPSMRMGELAVHIGLCSQADIDRALRTQRGSSPHVIDLLLRENHCEPEKLCRVLARYVRDLEERIAAGQPSL